MSYLDLIKQIEVGLSSDMAWLRAMEVFTEDRAKDWLSRLLVARHTMRGDAASFLYRGGFHMATRSIGTKLYRDMWEATPKDSAFFGVAECLAGYEAAAALELDVAAKRLRTGFYNALNASRSVFTADTRHARDLIELAREANLLEPSGYTGPEGDQPAVPPIEWLGPGQVVRSGVTAPLIVSVCDGRYFQTYGQRFLSSFERVCPDLDVWVHVINPDAETGVALTDLAENRPGVLVSIERGPHHTSYFASRRFLLAEMGLDRFERPVVTVDFDSVFHDNFRVLLGCAKGADIGYLRTMGEIRPTSIVKAAFLYAENSALARRFLRHTTRYLIGKLAEDPLWMIDQVALFRSVCLMRECPTVVDVTGRVAFSPLTALGADHILPLDDRVAQRGSVAATLQFSRTLKPIYATPHSIWGD